MSRIKKGEKFEDTGKAYDPRYKTDYADQLIANYKTMKHLKKKMRDEDVEEILRVVKKE